MSVEDPELDLLKQEYLSQIRGIFPLYRAALMFVALVIVIAVKGINCGSVSVSLLNLQLRQFVDFEKGWFATTTVLDALVAIAMLLIGVLLHRLVRWMLFVLIKKYIPLEDIARKMSDKSSQVGGGTPGNYFALKAAESEAKNWSKKISLLSLVSEVLLTLSLAFFYAGYFGNAIDYGVASVFFLCALVILARSFIVFLKNYLPYAMHVKGLSGVRGNIRLPE